ncbi:V-type proton ATPase 116 kDa subunit a 1-like isoform X4 [Littorina saxatilis]|uniref:V-type proton ATPase 116 kDa subunit a 1-like isoform X4 n=1 Tax=Littorina saxatilis TaxID=31220 RepID=UPI0038B44AA2
MPIFRSEEMVLCQFFLQSEASYACVSELGELGLVQFKDLNPNVNAFQRKFVNEVRRCEEMERKLRYTEKEIRKEKLKLHDQGENPRAPAPKEMVDLEAKFEKIESELREVNTNNEALKKNFQELSELKEVMTKTQMFFMAHGEDLHSIVDDAHRAMGQEDTGIVTATQGSVQLGFVAGVIPREKVPGFERLLWFACRGNVFLRHESIYQALEDPVSGDPVYKDVFIIFFQGEQLKNKVKKICEGFKASLYPCPETPQERDEMLRGVNTRLEDLKTVLSQTADHRHRVLVGAQKEIRTWIIKLEKIKAIYHTLNMFNFDVSQNSLIAECWCPSSALNEVRTALKNGELLSGSTVPSIVQMMQTKKKPPTFFQTNKFTKGFQAIVDAYGVASYTEVNPALYTIITFPFLFAIMFGDAGHGIIMFAFGLFMILNEKKFTRQRSDNEIWNTFLGGRYIITLMGLFSIYTGMIYNDIFSKSANIFGSAWRMGDYNETTTLSEYEEYTLDPIYFFRNGTPYPFGIDPMWQPAKNKIAFLNSLKMKLAVIVGISQMLFGICLSLFNHLHFRKYLSIFVEFIPEVIFLGCLFMYLVGLIFYKWVTFDASESQCAPALLIQYINMFMFSSKLPNSTASSGALVPCSQVTFYPNQQTLQYVFVICAVLSAPVLLLVKPLVLRSRHNRKMLLSGRAPGVKSTEALIPNEVTAEQVNPAFQKDEEDGNVKQVNPAFQKDEEDGNVKADGNTVSRSVNSEDEEVPHNGPTSIFLVEEEEDDFEFGEVFIHQAIHTIEFCLGCISHTASYLRLWALSLAHAQLSEVLWQMVFSLSLKMDIAYIGGIAVFALWFAWANLTIAVLLLMEGLSAFLHTLRLHWVEFQSKFYEGDGVNFAPFTFKELLKMDSLEDLK